MAKKLRIGRFTLKEERELIAMAAIGGTVSEAAAKFTRSAETIERMARAFGIQFKRRRGEIWLELKAK